MYREMYEGDPVRLKTPYIFQGIYGYKWRMNVNEPLNLVQRVVELATSML